MSGLSEIEQNQIITLLQEGIPITEYPFAEIGQRVNQTESQIIDFIKILFKKNIARRLGAIFDSESLGYQSVLVATSLTHSQMLEKESFIQKNSGITHCYLREGSPNFWFTLTAKSELFNQEKIKLQEFFGSTPLLFLPATRKYKIQVLFNLLNQCQTNVQPIMFHPVKQVQLTQEEQSIVRVLQNNLSPEPNFFDSIAQQCKMSVFQLLQILQQWKASGRMRRIGLIVRHYNLGIKGNGMAIWNVPENSADFFGRELAQQSEISHCYLRQITSEIPGNLFAMIHASDKQQLQSNFERIQNSLSLPKGNLFYSLKEFKKSSPQFFVEKRN